MIANRRNGLECRRTGWWVGRQHKKTTQCHCEKTKGNRSKTVAETRKTASLTPEVVPFPITTDKRAVPQWVQLWYSTSVKHKSTTHRKQKGAQVLAPATSMKFIAEFPTNASSLLIGPPPGRSGSGRSTLGGNRTFLGGAGGCPRAVCLCLFCVMPVAFPFFFIVPTVAL